MRRAALLLALVFAAPAPSQELPFNLPGAGGPAARSFADVADVTAAFEPAQARRGQAVTLKLTIAPKPGSYTYSFHLHPTFKNNFGLPPGAVVSAAGPFTDPPDPGEKPDPFDAAKTYPYYPRPVSWDIPLTVSAAAPAGKQAVALTGTSLQVCNANNCFPSSARDLPTPVLEVLPGPPVPRVTKLLAPPPAPPPAQVESSAGLRATAPKSAADHAAGLDAIADSLRGETLAPAVAGGLYGLLAAAVFWGFVSLATPCVFPMIPITVSLFLKQADQSTGTVLKLAAVYCATIIVVLGSAAVLLLTTFQALSVNEWMNLFLGALFVFFAVSLFGLFEVTLPKVVSFVVACGWVFVVYHAVQLLRTGSTGQGEWVAGLGGGAVVLAFLTYAQLTGRSAALESRLLQSTDRGRKTGGMLGTVFGALAFSIVSFTCVAPFLGGFAGVLQGSGNSRPALIVAGLAFAAAFASPFFVLALFPSLVKKLPKSGGWLDTVKAVMGFLELAAAFKFFRTAELRVTGVTELFTYDVCLGAWVAIAVVAGLYLLNTFRLPHDYDAKGPVGVGQLLLAIAFFGVAAYLAPGLAGHRPAGVVYAWVNSFLLPESDAAGADELPWSPDLKGTLDRVRTAPAGSPKLVFVDFTGKTCANCKLNEKNVFPRPEVTALLKRYALVQLYTDDVPPGFYAPPPPVAALAAEGELNKMFQEAAFGTLQLPLYVILEPRADGSTRVVGVYDEGAINDPARFAAFLRGPLGG